MICFRGPFITALGRTWCPGCFTCAQATCCQSLQEMGFVEEQGTARVELIPYLSWVGMVPISEIIRPRDNRLQETG